jgi:hypothetical protein
MASSSSSEVNRCEGMDESTRSESVDESEQLESVDEQSDQSDLSDDASPEGPGPAVELRREASQRLGRVAAATLALEKELALAEGWVAEVLAASVARHWAARALPRHPLVKDDGLGAAKLRTKLGQLVESLTKQVLALDEVQSHGDVVVKKSRRGIFTRLVKDLQAAERYLSRSARLVQLDASMRARSGTRPALTAMEEEAVEPLAQAEAAPEAPAAQPEHAKAAAETQDKEQAQQVRPQRRRTQQQHHQQQRQQQEKQSPQQPPKEPQQQQQQPQLQQQLEQERQRRLQLRYSMDEDEASVVIMIMAPGVELTLADARVEVDRASGQLKVSVRGFEPAAFDVTSRALLPLQTTFRLVGPNVLAVKIPKVRAAARRWGADEAAAVARLQLERDQHAREQQQLRREQARREALYLRELELQREHAMREQAIRGAYIREQQRELYLRQLKEEQRSGGGRCGQVYYANDPRVARSFWPLF